MRKRGLLITTSQLAEKSNLMTLLSEMGIEISIEKHKPDENSPPPDLCFIQTETEFEKIDFSRYAVPANMIYCYFNIPEQNKSSKSEFVAFLNHELRSPLNGIEGFLKLLEEEDLTETQMKYLSFINESCDTLVKTIEKLDSMISSYFN